MKNVLVGKSEEGVGSGQTLPLLDRPHLSINLWAQFPHLCNRADRATYLPHGVAEVMKESPDHRAWHRAGRQPQAAILLPLNPGDRGTGGKRSLDFHQGGMMAEDTLPETQPQRGSGRRVSQSPPQPSLHLRPEGKGSGQ